MSWSRHEYLRYTYHIWGFIIKEPNFLCNIPTINDYSGWDFSLLRMVNFFIHRFPITFMSSYILHRDNIANGNIEKAEMSLHFGLRVHL